MKVNDARRSFSITEYQLKRLTLKEIQTAEGKLTSPLFSLAPSPSPHRKHRINQTKVYTAIELV